MNKLMVSDGFSSFEVDFDQNNVGCLKHLHHAAPPLGMPCHQNPRQTINQPVLEKNGRFSGSTSLARFVNITNANRDGS